MIAVRELVKRYGGTVAVDGLTFAVEPGRVTGFLGPNGAGKSTTLRMVLGLDAPTSGSATVDGAHYRDLPSPTRRVGALLDPGAVDPGRTAHGHLLWQARAAGIGRARVDEVLGLVGLADRGGHRIRQLSLGMRQRLGIAGALLGDPGVLILDEPLNGLDPEGIVWVRRLLRGHADQGRTVLVSSHLMNEMEATADHVLVISRGRLVADVGVAELAAGARERVEVAAADPAGLTALLVRAGASVAPADQGRFTVTGMDAARVGETAAAHGIALHALVPVRARLEDAFIRLTGGHGRAAAGTADGTAAGAADRASGEGEWVR